MARYVVRWNDGKREFCEATLESYAVLCYLEKRNELVFFLDEKSMFEEADDRELNLQMSEINLIKEARAICEYDFQAAKLLGISPRRMSYKLQKYNLKEKKNGNLNSIY